MGMIVSLFALSLPEISETRVTVLRPRLPSNIKIEHRTLVSSLRMPMIVMHYGLIKGLSLKSINQDITDNPYSIVLKENL